MSKTTVPERASVRVGRLGSVVSGKAKHGIEAEKFNGVRDPGAALAKLYKRNGHQNSSTPSNAPTSNVSEQEAKEMEELEAAVASSELSVRSKWGWRSAGLKCCGGRASLSFLKKKS